MQTAKSDPTALADALADKSSNDASPHDVELLNLLWAILLN